MFLWPLEIQCYDSNVCDFFIRYQDTNYLQFSVFAVYALKKSQKRLKKNFRQEDLRNNNIFAIFNRFLNIDRLLTVRILKGIFLTGYAL